MLVLSDSDSTMATRHALHVDIHAITPLLTSCSDDEDHPVAAQIECGFDLPGGFRLLVRRECSCSGQRGSGLHDSSQGTRAQAAEDEIRSAE